MGAEATSTIRGLAAMDIAEATAAALYGQPALDIDLTGRSLQLRWVLLQRDWPGSAAWPALVAKVANAAFLVQLERDDLLCEALGTPLASMHPVGRLALLAEALAPLTNALEQRLQGQVLLEEPAASAVSGWPGCGIEFVLSDPRSGWSTAGIVRPRDEAAFVALAGLRQPAPCEAAIGDDLPLPCCIHLGGVGLPMHELDGIVRGDLLLIQENRTHDGSMQVRMAFKGSGAPRFTGHLQDDEITIVDTHQDVSSPHHASAARDADDMSALGELEVQLSFEISHTPITLRDLKRLHPGHVIRLEQPLTQAVVRICAGGCLIGKGQLLSVGDMLGVRVLDFARHDA